MRTEQLQEQAEERSISQNMRKHCDIVLHSRMNTQGQIFCDLKKGSVIRSLDRPEEEGKYPVYQQAEYTQQQANRGGLAAIGPIPESLPGATAEPCNCKKKTGRKKSQKIGFMGKVSDSFEHYGQNHQDQKDQQNDLSECFSHRCCHALSPFPCGLFCQFLLRHSSF